MPHHEDAEISVLGAMMCDRDAAVIAAEELTVESFYFPRHRYIFSVLVEFAKRYEDADEVLVCDRLSIQGFLEQAGGRDYIGRLIVKTPGAANVEEYCRIVARKHKDRLLIESAQKIAQNITKGKSVESELLEIESIYRRFTGGSKLVKHTFEELLKMDTEKSARTLIGQGHWLGRGNIFFVVAPAGIGKSVLVSQMQCQWTLGRDLFGIPARQPLRTLVIQAENDDVELALNAKGIANGMQYTPEECKYISDNSMTITESGVFGDKFIAWLQARINEFQPDLVLVDNLNSYIGGDVSDEKAVKVFLRNGLINLAQKSGCIIGVIHHTPKVRKEQTTDDMYLGAGSAEITNAPRGILVLQSSMLEGQYHLKCVKRNKPSGLRDSTGKPAKTVLLSHSEHGACWQYAAVSKPAVPQEHDVDNMVHECMLKLVAERWYERKELHTIICAVAGCSRSGITTEGRTGNKILKKMMGMLRYDGDKGRFQKA